MIPVVLFVGRSNTGKTTLIEGVIRCLKARNYRVGAVKHTGHPVEMDREGTDSWRFSEAGSDITVVASPGGLMVTRRWDHEIPLERIVDQYGRDLDILIVEGYKESRFPKIEVFRSDLCEAPLFREGNGGMNYLAVASDVPLEGDIPVLPVDDHEAICGFIVERLLERRDS